MAIAESPADEQRAAAGTVEGGGGRPLEFHVFKGVPGAEQGELLSRGLGITNLVDRATAAADELAADELIAGAGQLEALSDNAPGPGDPRGFH